MKKAAIYTRFSSDQGRNADQQRDELIAKVGNTHEIVGEYRDAPSGKSENRPGLTKLLEDAAKGEFGVLFCTDVTRFTRRLSPEILAAFKKAGVRVVTADGVGDGQAGKDS
jgi:DNA invertase Pin-like site-specific DNA recombinase